MNEIEKLLATIENLRAEVERVASQRDNAREELAEIKQKGRKR